MIDDLKASGRWDDTLFIVTSDHGENFGEHGHLSHVFSLHESLTRVPLVIHYPAGFASGLRVKTPVQLVDLFPTILETVGIDPSTRDLDGQVLPRSDAPDPDRTLVAEYYYPWQDLRFLDTLFDGDVPGVESWRRRLRSLRRGDMKLIWASDGRHELYDLAADPDESTNLVDDPAHAAVRDALLARLDAFVADNGGETPLPSWDPDHVDPHPDGERLDPETVQQLKELGYL
jgi:arylsulfatase A-like enzyme